MGTRLLCTAIALTAGLCMTPALAQSGSDASGSATKVLASSGTGFNVSSVEALIQRGDAAVASGNLVQAKKDYDNARTASKQLLAFYRDLSGSFRGLDARIPREMDTKGRAALALRTLWSARRPKTSVLQTVRTKTSGFAEQGARRQGGTG